MHYLCTVILQGIICLLLWTSVVLGISEKDPLPTSSIPSTSTSQISEESDTRFPPRHYSFDPRPNFDPNLLSLDVISANISDKGDIRTPGDFEDTIWNMTVSSPTSEQHMNNTSYNETTPENISEINEELQEGSRAIVDVQRQSLSGGVSYIIHPDNLPPPIYTPLENLPPPSHPVAQWRPDLFLELCCSPDNEDTTSREGVSSEINRDHHIINETDAVGEQVSSQMNRTIEKEAVGIPLDTIQTAKKNCTNDAHNNVECKVSHNRKNEDSMDVEDRPSITEIPSDEGQLQATTTSERSASNITQLVVELEPFGDMANKNLFDVSANHTPRYEESGSSTYQGMANFLKDIASSDGFQNAFLGDLISNFGSLDQNAMKLIYSLLIRPLEAAHQGSKRDRVGAAPINKPDGPNHLPPLLMLNKDKLPLRDEPANGYHPFLMPPPQKPPTIGPAHSQMHPSPAMQITSTGHNDHAWLPTRSMPKHSFDGLRGDEGVDVITAPPFQNFEVVLGSSFNHDDRPRIGGWNESEPLASQPYHGAPQHPMLFNKLRLGLEMPPPDALDALPPGSVLIPPSYILKQAKLPQVITKKDGTPGLEGPLSEFLPNLPFFGNDKMQRLQPPAKPQAHDIPPRLPSFLSSLLSSTIPQSKLHKSNPVRPGPHNRHMFLQRHPPTGPPPPITKLPPPTTKIPAKALAYPSPPSPSFKPPPVLAHTFAPYLLHKPVEQATPNVLPNSVNPSGLDVSGHIPVPVFVSMPPKIGSSVDDTSIQSPAVESSFSHEESIHKEIALGETETQSHEVIPLYVDYPDGVTHNKSSNINYHEHQYYDELPPNYILDYYDYPNYYDEQLERDDIHKVNLSSITPSFNHDTSSLHTPDMSDVPIILNDTTINVSDNPIAISNPDMSHDMPFHVKTTLQPSVLDAQNLNDEELHYRLAGLPFAYPPVNNGKRPPTISEPKQNDLQVLLQNHQMITAFPNTNQSLFNLNTSLAITSLPPQETQTEFMDNQDYYEIPVTSHRGNPFLAAPQPVHPSDRSPIPPPEVHYSGSDFAVSHLWNNVQLIPLAPELFDHETNKSEGQLNLTSLFHDPVSISPIDQPQIEYDNPDLYLKKLNINTEDTNAEITLAADKEIENAKFMAYVLIGACCGLALLSVVGIIIIIRFKKTCGSRQIRTRTRLIEQNSLENSSCQGGVGDKLTLGGESGHKLGSWFTGRHEQHLGSGKLRSNMTLPDVHNHKGKKNKSNSTRDLLSLTSESSASSCSSSLHHGTSGETKLSSPLPEDEEPRGSWLHGEYRTSHNDLSQVPVQDMAYFPHHYHGRDPHGHAIRPSSSPNHSNHMTHQQGAFRYRTESSMENEELQQQTTREQHYTGGTNGQERSSGGRHPRYVVSSLESEELNDRLHHEPSTTDSEAEDHTTHYEDELQDPSCYTDNSRELDETLISRAAAAAKSMTSQELGDHLSRDLKQYQSRRNGQYQEEIRDIDGEEGPEGQELKRSQSQVSFSRDNVQNEVFLEFDNIFRQHGQYLTGDQIPPTSTLGRVSRGTTDTLLSVSRANTPDSIDLTPHYSHKYHRHRQEHDPPLPSPPATPPRFSPPAPPRPPKPGHLSQPGTPSPKAERTHPSSPGGAPVSPSRYQRQSGNWTNEEERLI